MAIAVRCTCGKKLQAKASMAGKCAKCPHCGHIIRLPKPTPIAGKAFDLPDLSDVTAPPAAPQPGGPRPIRMGSRSSSAGKPNLILIGAAALAGTAAILVVVVVIFSLGGSDGRADGRELATTGDHGITEAAGPTPAPAPTDRRDPPTVAPRTEVPGPASNDAAATDLGPRAPESDDETASNEPDAPVEDTGFLVSISQWHRQPATALRGTRMVNEGQVVPLRYSWMCELLPFLGHQHQKLHDQFDFDKPWTEPQNAGLASTVVPEFVNPEDGRTRWEGFPYEGVALTHFVGMSGVEDQRNVVAAKLPRSDPRAGVFGYDDVAGPNDITDGLGKTIMVISAGEIVAPWVQGGGATIRGAREPYFDTLTGFGTRGSKGRSAVASFADGTVRRIAADVDPQVFRALCTTHGAETVDVAGFGPTRTSLPTGTKSSSPFDPTKQARHRIHPLPPFALERNR